MLPSSPQLPPPTPGLSHNGITGPPRTETFFSFPSAKKASHCPSGEKKGPSALSVPAISVVLAWSSFRVNNFDWETYTSRVPFGDIMASAPRWDPGDIVPRSTSRRTSGCRVGGDTRGGRL